MLLAANGWDALSNLFQVLIPIGIVVVLPLVIISLVMRNQRHEVDKKAEVMLKAVENGATLDPAFFQQTSCCKKRTVKDKLMGWLLAACITTGLGVMTALVMAYAFSLNGVLQKDPEDALFFIFPAILIGVGIAFFIVRAVGKRTWAKELAELNAKTPSAE